MSVHDNESKVNNDAVTKSIPMMNESERDEIIADNANKVEDKVSDETDDILTRETRRWPQSHSSVWAIWATPWRQIWSRPGMPCAVST